MIVCLPLGLSRRSMASTSKSNARSGLLNPIRWHGQDHAELGGWMQGEAFDFVDPIPDRPVRGHIQQRGKQSWRVKGFVGRDESGVRRYVERTVRGT